MNRWARGAIWGGGGVALVAALGLFNVIVLTDPTAQDLKFIAETCSVFDGISPLAIERSLIWDGSVDGYRYIAIDLPERSSFEGGMISYRSVFSEALCLPVVGCLLPPPLEPVCE